MDGQMVERFQEHFGQMKDPRVERTKLYPLEEILFVLLCGSICGAESWRDFVMFGQDKLDYLREYFPFSAGIPCKNTFARVSAALGSGTISSLLHRVGSFAADRARRGHRH